MLYLLVFLCLTKKKLIKFIIFHFRIIILHNFAFGDRDIKKRLKYNNYVRERF